MEESLPTIVIPAPEYFCNVVVFPDPTVTDGPKVFLMKNNCDVLRYQIGSVKVKYIPGSVYCLLPSIEKNNGSVSVFETKPSFLDSYACFLQIDIKSIDFLDCSPDIATNHVQMTEASIDSSSSDKCDGCFSSHFPSPSMSRCKWNKKKHVKRCCKETCLSRLRGGANDDPESLIIQRAVENAKAHGINVHAGVVNLGNGNCVFESIIDSINTRSSYPETLDGTPDEWRRIWMEEVEHVAYESWNPGMTRVEWEAGWSVLKSSRTYECKLGDLVLPGIAHCVKKDGC